MKFNRGCIKRVLVFTHVCIFQANLFICVVECIILQICLMYFCLNVMIIENKKNAFHFFLDILIIEIPNTIVLICMSC